MPAPPKKTSTKTLAEVRKRLANQQVKTRRQQSREKIVQEVSPDKKYVLFTDSNSRGSKVVVYGTSGMGKTTLCTMAPNPVFLATDDGIDNIMHPVTGKRMPTYKVDTFQDLKNMLTMPTLFENYDTIVIDTMTMAEEMAVAWVLDNVKAGNDMYVKSLEHYGWGKGYYHLSEADNDIKHALQKLVNQGKNVIVVCQLVSTKRSEAGVDDYLQDIPKLVYRPNIKATAALDFVEWADHVLKIGYGDLRVDKSNRAASSGDRVVFVHPEVHFAAKSRTIPGRFPVISFTDPADNSIWAFIFEDAWKDQLEEDEGE